MLISQCTTEIHTLYLVGRQDRSMGEFGTTILSVSKYHNVLMMGHSDPPDINLKPYLHTRNVEI